MTTHWNKAGGHFALLMNEFSDMNKAVQHQRALLSYDCRGFFHLRKLVFEFIRTKLGHVCHNNN